MLEYYKGSQNSNNKSATYHGKKGNPKINKKEKRKRKLIRKAGASYGK